MMWYALAALALIIYGPRLARAAFDSAADWSRAGKSLYAWSQGAGGFLASNSGWLKISASFLVGVVVCYVAMRGVRLPTIPDWLTPDTPVTVPEVPVKPTAVTYVWEKDNGGIPSGVLVALDKLNRQGIVATSFEQDTTDGTGETPEQYKLALSEAKKTGLPALVVMAGANVVRVVKVTTEAEVLEASR